MTGGLLVIAGHGDALAYPAAQLLVSAIKASSTPPVLPESDGESSEVASPQATTVSPGRALAWRGRPLGIALATGAAVALMPAVSRWISRRVRG